MLALARVFTTVVQKWLYFFKRLLIQDSPPKPFKGSYLAVKWIKIIALYELQDLCKSAPQVIYLSIIREDI